MNGTLQGHLVDIHQRSTFPAEITFENGRITSVAPVLTAPERYILPGFVDAHVHIESSMLTPAEFARLAVVHGTVATVSDPHEIANVCGREGVEWMIANAALTPFKTAFGAPSCVPATVFETAGDVLDAGDIDALLASPEIYYLAEMMNYPGVLGADDEVLAKISAAVRHGKPVDGHAPGLRGKDAAMYAAAGISTDHECTTLEEALDKIGEGMHILIREGSAAKNFDALHPLLKDFPERVMFCSDDKHPDALVLHHIDELVRRAVALGYNLYDVLRAASLNPVQHYSLPVGLLRTGDPADFIVVSDLTGFRVEETWINGECVARDGRSAIARQSARPLNRFAATAVSPEDLQVDAPAGFSVQMKVIRALDGQLLTETALAHPLTDDGLIVSDTEDDVLKLVVLNRYEAGVPPAVAFIQGFGLKTGALASTVAHDSHNIIAVGTDDASICAAINALIEEQGGIAVTRDEEDVDVLPLPVAGLMSTGDGYRVAEGYAALDAAAKALGSPLGAPFMTLSFMALPVIPALKLTDKGLFDGQAFAFTPLWEE
jgi:adenine deaminase